MVADSPALRVKRSRFHKAGDHTLCHPDRCPDAPRPDPTAAPEPPAAVEPEEQDDELPAPPADLVGGRIESITRALVDSLPYEQGDPRQIMGQLAIELAKRIDDDGAVPAAVRELRVLLVQLVEIPNGDAGPVDELRLRRAQKRLDGLLAAVA